ncbi:MAG: rhomboid protease N-terminal domain-containing protein, partial [Pseudomonas sp.]|nr:rhomboid protease N-terminal domain-containing protein [Pseudomonas sp.]
MSAIAALRLPLTVNLAAFVSLLQRLQVPHRVSEEAGEQVLWVPDEQFAVTARELYARYPQGDPQVRLASKPGSLGVVWRQLSVSWMTAAVLLLTLWVAAVTLLGEYLNSIHWLSFQDFRIQGDYLLFTPLGDS